MTEEISTTFGPRRRSATDAPYIRPPNIDSDAGPGDIIELQELQTHDELTYSSPSDSSGDEFRVVTRRTTSRALAARADARRRRLARSGIRGKITRFWMRNVTLVVPQKNNRDYFGAYCLFLSCIYICLCIDCGWCMGVTADFSKLWNEHSSRISALRLRLLSKGC